MAYVLYNPKGEMQLDTIRKSATESWAVTNWKQYKSTRLLKIDGWICEEVQLITGRYHDVSDLYEEDGSE